MPPTEQVLDATDLASLSTRELKDLCWRAGDLSYLVLPYQRPLYDAFWAWYGAKNKREVVQANRLQGAKYQKMMVWALCRRFGKTALALIIVTEFMIRRPGSFGYLTAFTKEQINPIVIQIINDVFAGEAPEGYLPQFYSSKDGISNVVEIPATGSQARLVGLDLYADRLRGTPADFLVASEVSYCSYDIAETYRAIIAPYFRKRPWAFALMESSYAESPDHPFHSEFAVDAQLRGAYHERRITQMDLTAEQIRDAEDESGGPEHPTTRRELHNEHLINRDRAVCASLTSANIVSPQDFEPPKFALGVVGLDPGNTDQAGLVFMVIEPSKRIATVVASWGGTKTSTDDLATIIRDQEKALWGTRASTIATETKRPLVDVLKAPREVPLTTVSMESLSIDNPTLGGWYQCFDAPEGTCTWWDDQNKTLRPNPWMRVSDVEPQQLQDMRDRHGLMFSAPKKGRDNMTLQIDLLNDHLHDGTLRIVDNESNAPLLKQMRSGRWNERRKDFERSKQLAHLDIVVALAIACRAIRWDIDPRRPIHVDPHARNFFTSPSVRALMEPLRSREKQRRRIAPRKR